MQIWQNKPKSTEFDRKIKNIFSQKRPPKAVSPFQEKTNASNPQLIRKIEN